MNKNSLPYIVLGLVVVSVGGYFVYRHYQTTTGDPAKNKLKINIVKKA